MKCLLKLFVCAGLLLFICCSCSSMLAAKTEIEIYDSAGNTIAKIFNNKSYQGLKWNVEKMPDGTVRIGYEAEVTDSFTIAKDVVEAQSGVINSLVGMMGVTQ